MMKRFWFDHVVYVENGKQKLRGRYYMILAGIIYFGGNYWIQNVLPEMLK